MMRISVLALLLLAGCSSVPRTTEFSPDKVVGRSDNMSSRPDWATETVSIVDKGDHLNVVGVVEVPGDSRAQAAFKASDAAARGHLANKIETQLTKIVQTADTGFSMDEQSMKSLIHEVSRVSFNGLDVKNRYWEKIVRTSSTGGESMVMKAFSLVEVPKDEVKRMIASSVEKKKAPKDVEEYMRSQIKVDELSVQ